MNGGNAFAGMSHLGAKRRMRRPPAATPTHAVPTIVFHGDADTTVHACNGDEIAAQAARAAHANPSHRAPLRCLVQRDGAHGGRALERTTLTDADGRPLMEQWLVRGAGHAWSGGSRAGSFTDPVGPDASGEMVRFFLAQ
jgi:poly(3-hydroxybutyrate) depolymerase